MPALNCRGGVNRWLSILIVTSFNAASKRDELDSAVQFSNFRLVVAWHAACMMHTECYIYSARLASFIHGVT